eukprot:COSAG03_NODE_1122_length_4774_cov_59.335401_6_plen_86_part_00
MTPWESMVKLPSLPVSPSSSVPVRSTSPSTVSVPAVVATGVELTWVRRRLMCRRLMPFPLCDYLKPLSTQLASLHTLLHTTTALH